MPSRKRPAKRSEICGVPELPEVETLRQDLAKEVVGRKVKSVAVTNGRSVRRHQSAKHFRAMLEGRTVKGVGRLGKYLLLTLDNKDTLVIHLGMSGQLLRVKSVKEPKPKHTHVVVVFTQGGELRYVDPRTFGEMFVSSTRSADTPEGSGGQTPASAVSVPPGMAGGDGAALRRQVPELAHLGFDPIEDMMSWDRFGLLLRQRHAGLKALLMDQQFVSGIGNLYSDEILFGAGLRYDRLSDGLSATEVRRLYRSMVETLTEAIKHRGSTLVDEQYRDLFGEVGEYQDSHQVYDREGQPCRRCRNPIVRAKLSGRSTFYCEHCQI
jgi:formamidopyrimidine-DNA glycosylase